MTNAPRPSDPEARPPFWQHRYYYLALKIVVIVVAAALALRFVIWLAAS